MWYIDDILRKLHPSYNIDLQKLRDDLKLAYLIYINKINNLLDHLDNIIIQYFIKAYDLKFRMPQNRSTSKFNKKISCKLCETFKEVTFEINVNGYIKFYLDNKEKLFLFTPKNSFKEFYRDIKDLFINDMDELNFQQMIDKLDDKRYLFEQTELVKGEGTLARIYLDYYNKYGFNINEIAEEHEKNKIIKKYFK
ncbi:hypothetical protein [Clostridium sp. JS66]|uniref:hypothetical protein n=1 Tax=Clostridium sp. JS66 TaxID=3064705 RepID=UPI00298D9BD0|nr:hypothetical protein [Clostridium sp. JS66]WPC40934.1 hypothetical protein Q6H37_24040 [Clostridium sp. JS66]